MGHRRQTQGRHIFWVFLVVVAVWATPALALPDLQLYIQGATYDAGSDTWVLTTDDPFKLWVIGDVEAKGNINNVWLTAAFASGLTPVITLTPTTTGGFAGFTDPSTPGAPSLVLNPSSDAPGGGSNCGNNGTDGNRPCLSDGTGLPTHGIFGSGTDWQEFALGNFTLTDSPIGDFGGDDVPPVPDGSLGQINVYTVSITCPGCPSDALFHFDTFDTVVGANHATNAPPSHDAETTGGTTGETTGQTTGETTGTGVPEPSSLLLLGSGMLGLWGMRRLSRRR